MRASDQPSSFLLERQNEDTNSSATNNIALSTYLRNLPSLSLSDKGKVNVCQRFKISPEELTDTLATLQRPSAPSNELLGIIAAAVGGHQAKGKGAALC